MKPNWQKLASLAQEICTLYLQFFSAVFASKGYPFKNILYNCHGNGTSVSMCCYLRFVIFTNLYPASTTSCLVDWRSQRGHCFQTDAYESFYITAPCGLLQLESGLDFCLFVFDINKLYR